MSDRVSTVSVRFEPYGAAYQAPPPKTKEKPTKPQKPEKVKVNPDEKDRKSGTFRADDKTIRTEDKTIRTEEKTIRAEEKTKVEEKPAKAEDKVEEKPHKAENKTPKTEEKSPKADKKHHKTDKGSKEERVPKVKSNEKVVKPQKKIKGEKKESKESKEGKEEGKNKANESKDKEATKEITKEATKNEDQKEERKTKEKMETSKDRKDKDPSNDREITKEGKERTPEEKGKDGKKNKKSKRKSRSPSKQTKDGKEGSPGKGKNAKTPGGTECIENKDEEEDTKATECSANFRKFIDKEDLQLMKCEWYHGLMPREEIEEMMTRDGQFLVRKTETGKANAPKIRYVLSARWTERPRHILLKFEDEKSKIYCWPSQKFHSVKELVEFYVNTKTPVQDAGTKLQIPVPRPDWYLFHEDCIMSRKLGSGAFGEIYLGELIGKDNKKTEVAIKMLKGKMGKTEREQFMKEANINRKFNHPNIVCLLGVASQKEPLLVVMEICSGGALKSHCEKNKDLPVTKLTKYLFEAAMGMEYLSDLDIVHRDLAARNCLLTTNFTVKISDFGLSCSTKELKDQKRQKMPIKWLAPEVLQTYQFSSKTDIWAYGIMMWEVYTRCASDPYPGMKNPAVRQTVLAGKHMDVPELCPSDLASVMLECWAMNPSERPNFIAIVLQFRRKCFELANV